jgi:hypothetical protein
MKRLIAATFAMLGLIAGFAAPATAGGNSTLPDSTSALSMMAGPCGSSYQHIGHYAIPASGTAYAYLDVYWSWTTKRNCLVTNHAGPTYGVSLYTEAKIRPTGSSWPSCPSSVGCDGGFYRYYAGPVYTPSGVNMTNRCVDISGWIDWRNRTLTKRHCG